MKKFSFKRGKKPTGKGAIGNPHATTFIKLDGREVGNIVPPSWRSKENTWKVYFAVQKVLTKENPCPFKWVRLKQEFETEADAREYLVKWNERILEKFSLHQFEQGTEV